MVLVISRMIFVIPLTLKKVGLHWGADGLVPKSSVARKCDVALEAVGEIVVRSADVVSGLAVSRQDVSTYYFQREDLIYLVFG